MIDSHNIQILIQHQQIGTLPRFDTANLSIHSNYLGRSQSGCFYSVLQRLSLIHI